MGGAVRSICYSTLLADHANNGSLPFIEAMDMPYSGRIRTSDIQLRRLMLLRWAETNDNRLAVIAIPHHDEDDNFRLLG